MHLITRTVASTFTAAMIATVAAPAAGAATLVPAGAATTTTVGVPLRDPDKCGSAFYRLRHHFFCKRHRHYS